MSSRVQSRSPSTKRRATSVWSSTKVVGRPLTPGRRQVHCRPEARVLVAGRAVGDAVHTGLGLWEAGLAYVEGLFGFKATIDQLRLAALIHAGAAVVAITIWIIHVYAAIWVRGTLSAMTRGFVTGGWGWRHHRKWRCKEVEKGDVERPRLRLRSNPRPNRV